MSSQRHRGHSSPRRAPSSDEDKRSTTTSPSKKNNRIGNIFDEARNQRLGMMAQGEDIETSPPSLRNRMAVEGEGLESSADEETSIVNRSLRHSNTMNYQATNQWPTSLTNRPTTASIRRNGRVHSPGEHVDETEVDEEEGWWARLISDYGSIELENKGSVARDHLALERTFLAWLRTSLAFASIGIAITQLFRLNVSSAAGSGTSDPYQHLRQMGKPLGATFLGISIVMLIVGFHRYFESQHWIIRGKFPASRGSITLVAAITFALMVTSLAVVLVVEPRAFEKRSSMP